MQEINEVKRAFYYSLLDNNNKIILRVCWYTQNYHRIMSQLISNPGLRGQSRFSREKKEERIALKIYFCHLLFFLDITNKQSD